MADPKQSFDITKTLVPIAILSIGGLFGWVMRTEATRYTADNAHHDRHEIQKETHNFLREAKEDIMLHHNAMQQRIGRLEDELSDRITRLETLHMTPAKE